jgi:hypothetical protein
VIKVWIVTGTVGRYSDTRWWIDSVHATMESANTRLNALNSALAEVSDLHEELRLHGAEGDFVVSWQKRYADALVRASAMLASFEIEEEEVIS